MSKKSNNELLREAHVFEILTAKQIAWLVWWEIFRKHKIAVFYEALEDGKSAIAAYRDAKETKRSASFLKR